MSTANIPPVSYESLKLILEYINLDTRVRIRHCIPEIQEIESRTPCHLETFSIGQEVQNSSRYYITVNHKKWTFDPDYALFLYKDTCRGAYKALAQKYLISESHIQHFYLGDWPEGLFKTDPSFKLFIKEFYILKPSKLPKFISADHVKKIATPLDFEDPTIGVLQDPIVKSVEHLHLWFSLRASLDEDQKTNLLLSLRNKIVSVVNQGWSFDFFPKLVENWLSTRRPIGHKFQMEDVSIPNCYHLISPISIEHKQHVYPTPDFGDMEVSHAVALSVDDNSLLVVYAPEGKYMLIMEMMEKIGRA